MALVNCDTKVSGAITFWFQINTSGVKYLFTLKGEDVKAIADAQKYKVNKNAGKVSLAIQSFEKRTDSGLYTCAAMNNNKLIFGEVTEINGGQDQTPQLPKISPTDPKPFVVTTEKTQCTCKEQDFRTSQCPHNHIQQPQTTPADNAKLLDTPLYLQTQEGPVLVKDFI
ncbi:hypothetical protein Q8A67_022330 [Cirrhinus molitorella]|uniref:Ig-like domain-containing protein n=1 Tax=Cirrhinus molitorella TaxID=172907 RepID=A0AA88TDD7_9TELE|nr:hypothetical protein Q8A67_022330 [Cirrhinus molitorella]